MDSEKEEKFIKNVLSDAFNLEVKKIPIEKNAKNRSLSPDFVVSDGEYKYLMELKTKFDSNELMSKRATGVATKDVYREVSGVNRNNGISSVIKKAVDQLKIMKEKESVDFCLIILHAIGINEIPYREKFINTLYGRKTLLVRNGGSIPMMDCYYYSNSDFYNHRHDLDGAIIIGENKATLCLNDLSKKYSKLRETPLVNSFAYGVIDPVSKEESGEIFTIRENIDRGSEDALNKYLSIKYDLLGVSAFDKSYHTLISRIKSE